MDPTRNPYAPGAGTPPPELAGRDALLERVRVALSRIRLGRSAKSVVMVGLRGVGKTVLLETMRLRAEGDGVASARLEAMEGRSLPGLLAPVLRASLLRLSASARRRDLTERALRALSGFVSGMKVKYQDLELGLTLDPEPGLADSADLALDLQSLLEACGEAAQAEGTALGLFVDEVQYVPEMQLEALIGALHRCAQRSLPVVMVGAGLPQLRGLAGRAKSYAERLFEFPVILPLDPDDAARAIVNPALDEGVSFEPAAVQRVVRETQGYPYFLQEWGKHCWDVSSGPVISDADAQRASASVVPALDAGFFRVRFDRLTLAEKKYLRAMAELGPGPHRSGSIAARLGRKVTAVAPIRANLIDKGMIWSPAHGDTAFTVPLFDEFMRRILPGDDWEE